jgi:hypothetical protein
MELNRFKQLLESTMGDAKPLISEQKTSYTLQSDKYELENAGNTTMPELKLFKGTTFNKVGENLVANTKFQFVDTLSGEVTAGANTIDTVDGSQVGKFTVSGKVTYYCKLGKFTADKSKAQYYDEDGYLTKTLAKICNTKVVPTSTETKSNHICDTDKTSQLQTGRSFKYCKNGEDYYFIGTAGEFQTKYPEWTQAKGSGLESIKTKIFYK